MKAITIHQPWASLLAHGVKQYETRSWPTKYRGPIAIHAAKRDIFDTLALIPVPVALKIKEALHCEWGELPTGCVLATAELVNVWHVVYNPGTDVDKASRIPVGAESITEDKHAPDFGNYFIPSEQEMALGDWTPGRYAWELQNVRLLPEPIPTKGKQGLWNWEPET